MRLAGRLSRMRESIGGSNFAWVASGQVAFGLAQAGVLSVLARLGGPDVVGQLALALAIVTPVFQLVRLRLRDVVATDVDSGHPLSDYMRVAAISAFVGLAASFAIGVLLDVGRDVLVLVGLMSLTRGVEALSHVSYGHQQRNDRMGPVGRSLMMRGFGSVALLTAAYAPTGNVMFGAVGILAGHMLILLFYDLPQAWAELRGAGTGASSDRAALWRLALAAAPLGLFSFLVALGDNLPRVVLGSSRTLAAVGIFSAFGYVVAGASAVTRALGQVSSPRLAQAIASRDRALLRRRLLGLVGFASVLGITFVIGAALVGARFLEVFFGADFAAYSFEFTVMATVGWLQFVASPLTVALIAARRYGTLLAVQTSSVTVLTVVAVVTAPTLGIRGAVYSLVAGAVVRVAGTSVALWSVARRFPEPTINSD